MNAASGVGDKNKGTNTEQAHAHSACTEVQDAHGAQGDIETPLRCGVRTQHNPPTRHRTAPRPRARRHRPGRFAEYSLCEVSARWRARAHERVRFEQRHRTPWGTSCTADQQQSGGADEATCAATFRYVKQLTSGWLRDVVHDGDEQAKPRPLLL